MTAAAKAAPTTGCNLALTLGNRAPRTGGFTAGNDWIIRCVAKLRAVAPYAAIELILPGGSLLAVGLWVYRRYRVVRAQRAAL